MGEVAFAVVFAVVGAVECAVVFAVVGAVGNALRVTSECAAVVPPPSHAAPHGQWPCSQRIHHR